MGGVKPPASLTTTSWGSHERKCPQLARSAQSLGTHENTARGGSAGLGLGMQTHMQWLKLKGFLFLV